MKTHAELEAPHYQALHNPNYRLEGLLNTMLDGIETITPEVATSQPEPEWTESQWQVVKQLQAEVRYLHKKFLERKTNKKYKTYGEG